MVKIIPFSGYLPITNDETILPKLNSHEMNSEAYKSINNYPNIKIEKNSDSEDIHFIYNEIMSNKSALIYEKLRRFWLQYESLGLFKEEKPSIYVYRIENEIEGKFHSQLGIICCVFLEDLILGHENTIEEKLKDQYDRLKHLRTSISPVYLMNMLNHELNENLEKISYTFPIIDFYSTLNVRHTIWRVDNSKIINLIKNNLKSINKLYIADGHHRIESSRLLRATLISENSNHTGNENYNYILSAIFPVSQLRILEYNRIIKNVKNFKSSFLPKLEEYFNVIRMKEYTKPEKPDHIVMYRSKRWYKIIIKKKFENENSLKKSLATYKLQKYVFENILLINDIRKSKRLIYLSGNLGVSLIQKIAEDQRGIAFLLHPISIKQVLAIADNNNIVPPKSTWFEPKLLKGLIFWKF